MPASKHYPSVVVTTARGRARLRVTGADRSGSPPLMTMQQRRASCRVSAVRRSRTAI
jgi:hypothetical protein